MKNGNKTQNKCFKTINSQSNVYTLIFFFQYQSFFQCQSSFTSAASQFRYVSTHFTPCTRAGWVELHICQALKMISFISGGLLHLKSATRFKNPPTHFFLPPMTTKTLFTIELQVLIKIILNLQFSAFCHL